MPQHPTQHHHGEVNANPATRHLQTQQAAAAPSSHRPQTHTTTSVTTSATTVAETSSTFRPPPPMPHSPAPVSSAPKSPPIPISPLLSSSAANNAWHLGQHRTAAQAIERITWETALQANQFDAGLAPVVDSDPSPPEGAGAEPTLSPPLQYVSIAFLNRSPADVPRVRQMRYRGSIVWDANQCVDLLAVLYARLHAANATIQASQGSTPHRTPVHRAGRPPSPSASLSSIGSLGQYPSTASAASAAASLPAYASSQRLPPPSSSLIADSLGSGTQLLAVIPPEAPDTTLQMLLPSPANHPHNSNSNSNHYHTSRGNSPLTSPIPAGPASLPPLQGSMLATAISTSARSTPSSLRPVGLMRNRGTNLRVATYNVYFELFSDVGNYVQERLPLMVAELEALDADVIGLQEVTPFLFDRLRSSSAVLREQYFWTEIPPTINDGRDDYVYGQVILSRYPILECAYVSLGRYRQLLVAALFMHTHASAATDPADNIFLVANLHLKSDYGMHTGGNADARASEQKEIFRVLSAPAPLQTPTAPIVGGGTGDFGLLGTAALHQNSGNGQSNGNHYNGKTERQRAASFSTSASPLAALRVPGLEAAAEALTARPLPEALALRRLPAVLVGDFNQNELETATHLSNGAWSKTFKDVHIVSRSGDDERARIVHHTYDSSKNCFLIDPQFPPVRFDRVLVRGFAPVSTGSVRLFGTKPTRSIVRISATPSLNQQAILERLGLPPTREGATKKVFSSLNDREGELLSPSPPPAPDPAATGKGASTTAAAPASAPPTFSDGGSLMALPSEVEGRWLVDLFPSDHFGVVCNIERAIRTPPAVSPLASTTSLPPPNAALVFPEAPLGGSATATPTTHSATTSPSLHPHGRPSTGDKKSKRQQLLDEAKREEERRTERRTGDSLTPVMGPRHPTQEPPPLHVGPSDVLPPPISLPAATSASTDGREGGNNGGVPGSPELLAVTPAPRQRSDKQPKKEEANFTTAATTDPPAPTLLVSIASDSGGPDGSSTTNLSSAGALLEATQKKHSSVSGRVDNDDDEDDEDTDGGLRKKAGRRSKHRHHAEPAKGQGEDDAQDESASAAAPSDPDNFFKSFASALVIIPPPKLCAHIDILRKQHDRAFSRWMPHVTLLFPFVHPAKFALALPRLEEVLRPLPPFRIILRKLAILNEADETAKKHILVIVPEVKGDTLFTLQAAVQRAFPQCQRPPMNGQAVTADGFPAFHPHITIGQISATAHRERAAIFDWFKRNWQNEEFTVSHVHVLHQSSVADSAAPAISAAALRGDPTNDDSPPGPDHLDVPGRSPATAQQHEDPHRRHRHHKGHRYSSSSDSEEGGGGGSEAGGSRASTPHRGRRQPSHKKIHSHKVRKGTGSSSAATSPALGPSARSPTTLKPASTPNAGPASSNSGGGIYEVVASVPLCGEASFMTPAVSPKPTPCQPPRDVLGKGGDDDNDLPPDLALPPAADEPPATSSGPARGKTTTSAVSSASSNGGARRGSNKSSPVVTAATPITAAAAASTPKMSPAMGASALVAAVTNSTLLPPALILPEHSLLPLMVMRDPRAADMYEPRDALERWMATVSERPLARSNPSHVSQLGGAYHIPPRLLREYLARWRTSIIESDTRPVPSAGTLVVALPAPAKPPLAVRGPVTTTPAPTAATAASPAGAEGAASGLGVECTDNLSLPFFIEEVRSAPFYRLYVDIDLIEAGNNNGADAESGMGAPEDSAAEGDGSVASPTPSYLRVAAGGAGFVVPASSARGTTAGDGGASSDGSTIATGGQDNLRTSRGGSGHRNLLHQICRETKAMFGVRDGDAAAIVLYSHTPWPVGDTLGAKTGYRLYFQRIFVDQPTHRRYILRLQESLRREFGPVPSACPAGTTWADVVPESCAAWDRARLLGTVKLRRNLLRRYRFIGIYDAGHEPTHGKDHDATKAYSQDILRVMFGQMVRVWDCNVRLPPFSQEETEREIAMDPLQANADNAASFIMDNEFILSRAFTGLPGIER